MKASINNILAIACDDVESCNVCAKKYSKTPCNVYRQLFRSSLRDFIKTNDYKDFKEKLKGAQNGEG